VSNFDENNWINRRKTYKSKLTVDYFFDGIIHQDIKIISSAITLIESDLESDQLIARQLLDKCLLFSGKSFRIGITGVPGVGKSTFIEAIGLEYISKGKKVAVLSIDPSSTSTNGSILGDKTRMENLSKSKNAFIRPTSSGNQLGGIAKHTKETLLICEAAGFDIILIETVGVGQSETMVYEMSDFFLLLMLAGAGDELQGIKRGIIELADSIIITKADGENILQARKAVNSYKNALHLFPLKNNFWNPVVTMYSYLNMKSIQKVINIIDSFFENQEMILSKRKHQERFWVYQYLKDLIMNDINLLSKNKEFKVLKMLDKGEINSFEAAKIFYKTIKQNEKN